MERGGVMLSKITDGGKWTSWHLESDDGNWVVAGIDGGPSTIFDPPNDPGPPGVDWFGCLYAGMFSLRLVGARP